MKMNKFILAAGVIGVAVGVLRLALVFVNTIPSPQQFPKWVWLVLASLTIVVYALVALSGRKRAPLLWICVALDIIGLFLWNALNHAFGRDIAFWGLQSARLVTSVTCGLIVLVVALANEGAFRRSLFGLSTIRFISILMSIISMFMFMHKGRPCVGMLYSVLISSSRFLNAISHVLLIAAASTLVRSGCGKDDPVGKVPLVVRIIPLVIPLSLLLLQDGRGAFETLVIVSMGVAFGKFGFASVAVGWVAYITVFILFFRCRSWIGFAKVVGAFALLILLNFVGCASMLKQLKI